MKCTRGIFFFIMFSFGTLSAQEVHYGPMLAYANTTITVATGNIVIGPSGGGTEKKNTGYQNNVAFGGYFTIPFSSSVEGFWGSEIFYNRTTSKDLEDISLAHLHIIPTLGVFPLRSNFYAEIGAGAGIMLEDQGLQTNFGDDIRRVDFSGKLSCGYHFRKIGRVEIGFYGSSEMVKSQAARIMFLATTKLQLDGLLKSI
nr:hypothetical protein [Allomuricauda sp.]